MKHEFKQRIIYKDTDAEGVVYYANYLGFFERGRTELLRQMGVSLTEIKKKLNIVFAVTRVETDYLLPAQYDDEIVVSTEIENTTKARIIFKQEASRGKEILVSAKVSLCALNLKTFKPTRLPSALVK